MTEYHFFFNLMETKVTAWTGLVEVFSVDRVKAKARWIFWSPATATTGSGRRWSLPGSGMGSEYDKAGLMIVEDNELNMKLFRD